jgi:hypothetical protein
MVTWWIRMPMVFLRKLCYSATVRGLLSLYPSDTMNAIPPRGAPAADRGLFKKITLRRGSFIESTIFMVLVWTESIHVCFSWWKGMVASDFFLQPSAMYQPILPNNTRDTSWCLPPGIALIQAHPVRPGIKWSKKTDPYIIYNHYQ